MCTLSQNYLNFSHKNQACHVWNECNGIKYSTFIQYTVYVHTRPTYIRIVYLPLHPFQLWQARFLWGDSYYFCHSMADHLISRKYINSDFSPIRFLFGSPSVPLRFPFGSSSVPMRFSFGSPSVPLKNFYLFLTSVFLYYNLLQFIIREVFWLLADLLTKW